MSKLVFESLNELFENKKAKAEKEDKPKMANVAATKSKIEKTKSVKVTQDKKERAEQAIKALRKQLEDAKKPGRFNVVSAKNKKIKELEDKIKAWEKKK